VSVTIVIRTLIIYFLLTIFCIVFAIPILIYLLVPERWRYHSYLLAGIVDAFYNGVLKCTLLPINYVGLNNLPQGAVIFVANHQSALDVPVLGSLAHGTPHIWLAKKELLDSRMLRFVLPRTSVLVDTSSQMKAMRSLLTAIKLVNDGHHGHVMLFPEGGRFTDGKVHDFFGGFVLLAKETKRPIVPVFINGVAQAYPPDAFLVHTYPITVTIGKPFYYQEGQTTDKEFKNLVYNWFVQEASDSNRNRERN